VVLPYWNALSFFTTYAAVDGFDPRTWQARAVAERRPMDRWILSVMQSLIQTVNVDMEGYRLYSVVPRLVTFIDQLTNVYIRSNRKRFWKSDDRLDQTDAYQTLYTVLTTFNTVLAPFMPFITEEVHQRLVLPVDPTAPACVHWCDYPRVDPTLIDTQLEADIAIGLTVLNLGRKLRDDHKLKVRQPLSCLTVVSREAGVRSAIERFKVAVMDELNVKTVSLSSDEAAFCTIAVKPNFKELRRVGAKLKEIQPVLSGWGHAEVTLLESGATIAVAGEELSLKDVLLQRTPVAGAVVASDGPVTVALDTTLTPALESEGLAREFISLLQQGRKDAGLEVSDRIRVTWHSDDANVQDALRTHARTIADEVLATAFVAMAGGTAAELNGRTVQWSLAKA